MPVVDVRWADLAVPGWTAGWLRDAERERMARLREADDRARFLGAHVLGRIVVADRSGCHPDEVVIQQRCPTCDGPHGPPVAIVPTGPAPTVSLAHAGGLVVAAVASASLGVDVEPVEQPAGAYAAIAEHLASEETDPQVLLRSWVAHEAVAKARGTGIVEPAGPAHGAFAVVELDLDGRHVGAVAVRSSSVPSVVARELRWTRLRGAAGAPAPTATTRTGR